MSARRLASELTLLAAIMAFAIWFAMDASRASPTLENLVLIVPGAVLTVAVALWLAVSALRAPRVPAAEAPPGFAVKVAGLLLLLVLLVAGLETVGFDTASFLFLLCGCWLLGERRPLPLAAFAVILTVIVVTALHAILPFPMPTLLL
jgi:hypothetical protein